MTDRRVDRFLDVVSERLSSSPARTFLEFVAVVAGTVLVTAAPNPPQTLMERLQVVGGAMLIAAAGASAGITLVAAVRAGVRAEIREALGQRPEPGPAKRSGARLVRPLIAVALLGLAVTFAAPPVAGLLRGLSYAVRGCPLPVQLRMVAEPETITTAREVAAAFEGRTGADDYGCPSTRIHVFAASAASIADHVTTVDGWADDNDSHPLRDIGPRPDLWLASTGHEVTTVANKPGTHPIADHVAVARSPLVLAVAGSAAQPGAGWSALVNRYTAREPGVVRPDPTGSLGLLATTLIYDSERSSVPSSAVSGLQLAVGVERRLAGTAGDEPAPVGDEADLLCARRAEPPPRPGDPDPPAIITTEQQVARYNAGLPLGDSCGSGVPDPTRQLTALYPTDTGDQRPELVRLDWSSPAQTAAARDFADWLTGDAGGTALVHTGLRPLRPGPLDLPLTTDFGVSPALAGQSAPVADSRVDQAAATYQLTQRASRLLFAFDTSDSMSTPDAGGTRAQVAAAAVKAGLRRLGPRDEFGLWFFSGDGRTDPVEKVQLGARDPGRLDAADRALDGVAPRGDTPLFRMIVDGVATLSPTPLRPAPEPGRDDPVAVRALVVLTDGEDTSSGISAADTASAIGDRGVRVVVVAVGGISCAGGGLPAVVDAKGNDCVTADASTVGDRVTKIVDQLKGGTG